MTYIAFEGGEGSGKSTQAALLAKRLGATLTREPGGTPLGQQVRSLLLSPETGVVDPMAEVLLMAADRAQHLQEIVSPVLKAGSSIVSDRSVYSSLAYQGAGRKLGTKTVWEVNEFALQGCLPELVVLLDVSLAQAEERLIDRSLDRFEQAGEGFHSRVLQAYRDMAEADPDRWIVIDGFRPVKVIAEDIWQQLQQRVSLGDA